MQERSLTCPAGKKSTVDRIVRSWVRCIRGWSLGNAEARDWTISSGNPRQRLCRVWPVNKRWHIKRTFFQSWAGYLFRRHDFSAGVRPFCCTGTWGSSRYGLRGAILAIGSPFSYRSGHWELEIRRGNCLCRERRLSPLFLSSQGCGSAAYKRCEDPKVSRQIRQGQSEAKCHRNSLT